VVAQKVSNLCSVGRIFVDPKLEVLAEVLVEGIEVVLVLSNLGEQLKTTFDEVLANDFQDLALLKSLT